MTSARSGGAPPSSARRRLAALLAGVLALSALGLVGAPAPAGAAPGSGTGPGGQTLTVSEVDDLDPAGTTVTVTGTGYDAEAGFDVENSGLYLAFCVDNGAGQRPTPCVGGVDMTGESSASRWVTNNPLAGVPPEAVVPITADGSFETTLLITAGDEFTSCLDREDGKECKVVTYRDHRNFGDRSQDVLVPVTFGDGAPVPDGPEITLDPATGADPYGQDVVVSGTGFPTEAPGFYVVVGPEPENTTDASPYQNARWVGTSPGAQVPLAPDGSFTFTFEDVTAVYTGGNDVDYDFRLEPIYVSTFRAHGVPDPAGDYATSTPLTFAPPTVTLSKDSDLDPLGEDVVVTGTHFPNEAPGLYVVFGPVPENNQSAAPFRPAAWVRVTDIDERGNWEVTLSNIQARYTTSGGVSYDFLEGGGHISTFRAQGRDDPDGLWESSTPVSFRVRSATESFVTAALTDFLGAPPSDQDVADAVASIEGGTPRVTFLRQLARSDAWLAAVVEGLYQDTLGRPADDAGRAYWIDEIRSGRRSVAWASAEFYASAEYFNGIGGGTVETWIDDLYEKILLREPDATGHAFWVGETATKGRGNVARRFFQSQESAETRVKDLYQQLLGRPADAGGLAHWSERVVREGDIALAVNLAVSSEYANRAAVRFP